MDIALSRATVALSPNMTPDLSTGSQALNHSWFDLSHTDITLFNDLCRGNALVQLWEFRKGLRKQDKK